MIDIDQNIEIKKIGRIFSLCLMLLFASGFSNAQDSLVSPIPKGKWLRARGPFDPRPYPDIVFNNPVINDSYFDFKNRLWVEKGFSFGGYISANIQAGSQGGPAHGISESLILGAYEIVRTPKSAGRIVFGVAHDHTFGHPTTRVFADNQRLIETPNDLDTDPDLTFTTIGLLLWAQEWHTDPTQGFGFKIGQIYAPSYFGPARYLDDDRRYFMARPLAAAGGAQWVGNNDIGLGAVMGAWKRPFYITIGAIDGMANRNYPDFESIAQGNMLYLGEIGLERDPDGPNEAAIRVTFSHLDINQLAGSGQSIMVSGDIHFNGKWALAWRWSKSLKRLMADHQELFSLGILWISPFSSSQDLAGFGLFSGKPSDAAHNWESGFEVFYKLQLTHAVSVLPDLQYWFRNDWDIASIQTWIIGLRSEVEF